MSDSTELVPDTAIVPTDVIPVITCDTGGVLVNIHKPDKCAGRPCCIHNPSDHPLRDAPMLWRGDRRIMERICEHRIGHPDPDDVRVRTYWEDAIHGCDGCCTGSRHDASAT